MTTTDSLTEITDLQDKRSGTDRRQFDYTAYIPERRSGRERRKGFDRRGSQESRTQERRYITSNRKRSHK